jgi:hypothetical protein
MSGAPTLSWIDRGSYDDARAQVRLPSGFAYRTTDTIPLVWEVVENAWNRNLGDAEAPE